MALQRIFSSGDFQRSVQAAAAMGMGRTDSELAFQEFLKRIPSASNLAAIAGSAGALPGDLLLPSSAHLGANGFAAAPQEGTGATVPHHHHSASAAGGPAGGVPRVSSLDFLARLISPSYPASAPPGVATAAAAAAAAAAQAGALFANMPPKDAASLPPHSPLGLLGFPPSVMPDPYSAALSTAALHPAAAGNPLAAAAAAAALTHPAAAAAAALQLQGQLHAVSRLHASAAAAAAMQHQHNHQHGHGSGTAGGATSAVRRAPSATSHSDDEAGDKTDQRKARRMLSNRESARRSRRRKQEHLNRLETELNEALEEKRQLADRSHGLEQRCLSAEEENKRLRDENEQLRDELRFLRNEVSTERKDRNAWRRFEPNHEHNGDLGGFGAEPSAMHGGSAPPSKRGRSGGHVSNGGGSGGMGVGLAGGRQQRGAPPAALPDEGEDDSGQYSMRHYLPLG